MELVFSEGPEKIPGRFLTLQVVFIKSGYRKRYLEKHTKNFLHFSLHVILCSVLPPLPPGEKGCGMLQRGNVVWSVCWQRGKKAQHVLPQSPTGVELWCVGVCAPQNMMWIRFQSTTSGVKAKPWMKRVWSWFVVISRFISYFNGLLRKFAFLSRIS